MAKITTITNPLTGQPVQVDQLDHTAQEIDDAIARTLPGGAIDALLQNKAPAGYGLGELSGKILTASDNIDNIRVSGIYTYSWNPSEQPSGLPAEAKYHTGLLIVTAGVQSTVEQKIVFVKDSSTVNTGDNCTVHRLSLGTSAWQPLEWVNPPMNIGKEYRTTERYQGKPVYAKCVQYPGVTPSGYGEYAHGIANISSVIRASGELRNKDTGKGVYMPVFQNGGGVSTSSHVAYFTEVSGTYIAIYTGGNYVGRELYVTMYYTKTTD